MTRFGRFVDLRTIHQRMDAKDDRIARALRKPVRGEALLEKRERRADRIKAEEKEMRAALVRDRMRCRWPGCSGKHRGLELPIDPCHFLQHRGMGGDGIGERTRRDLILGLCRKHHGELDAGLIDIQPLSDQNADGLLAFYVRNETGAFDHVASETSIGVSVARS